jgi:peptide/nickel transport system permease protein
MPKFVFLWTDLVLWLVAAGAVVYAWHVRRDPQRSAPWRHVLHDAPAMCAAVLLLVFTVIALLDSVHFRPRLAATAGAAADAPAAYGTRTLSLLDVALVHAIDSREKTYSAPLAYRSFQKETAVVDGKEVREFPRLDFGGVHLKEPEREWTADVATRGLTGAALGLLLALVLAALVARRHARGAGSFSAALREIASGATEIPWRAILVTVAILAALIGAVAALWPAYHVLGTDRTGNDVLYQALKSIRTALVIGSLSTIATLPLAMALGIVAGYFKGWVDDAIQYLYTVLSSIPPILLVAAFVLMVNVYIDQNVERYETGVERAEFRLFLLCLILGVTGWATLCRLLRAETLKLTTLDFVQAAHAFGVGHLRIMWRHILPNVMHLVLIVAVLDFSALVLYEAVLSYVGVGVDPNSSSFGSMINLARSEMAREPVVWWNLATAFTFMLALVLAANLFADAVREAFDPRARVFRPRRFRLKEAA